MLIYSLKVVIINLNKSILLKVDHSNTDCIKELCVNFALISILSLNSLMKIAISW